MQRLSQGMKRRQAGDNRLPDIITALAAKRLGLRRGQLLMIVGQSNSGKSLMSLYLSVMMARQNIRILFFSADTDEDTMRARAAAIVMQKPVDEIEEMMRTSGRVLVEEAMMEFDRRLAWCWNPAPSMEDVRLQVLAADEAWGTMPDLIVVDNLMNLAHDSDNEYAAMRQACSDFHQLSRVTGAAVVVLHHVSENASKPDWPAPKGAIHGKLSPLPEMIWSVAMLPKEDRYLLSPVKDRHGTPDPKAEDAITLYVDAPRMSIYSTHQELSMARTRAEYE